MHLVDTHCHIHDPEYSIKYQKTSDVIIADAKAVGVMQCICVGTDVASSAHAVDFAKRYSECFASLAIHPHEAATMDSQAIKLAIESLRNLYRPNESVVAIGECGLDYFYHKDEKIKSRQQELFIAHIELAQAINLPMIFHIREAFDDFFRIIDNYPGINGVVHSFSAGVAEMQGVVERGLYAGLNGIMTFTKDNDQLRAAKLLPIGNMLLETDAPFLTPKPFRGTMSEPKHVINITQFLSELRGESVEDLAEQTTKNARRLFSI